MKAVVIVVPTFSSVMKIIITPTIDSPPSAVHFLSLSAFQKAPTPRSFVILLKCAIIIGSHVSGVLVTRYGQPVKRVGMHLCSSAPPRRPVCSIKVVVIIVAVLRHLVPLTRGWRNRNGVLLQHVLPGTNSGSTCTSALWARTRNRRRRRGWKYASMIMVV